MKNSKSTKWWERTRKKGKTRYILVNGVLFWGVPMLIFMSFIGDRNPFSNGLFSAASLVHYIVWLGAGLVYGFAMWHYFERKYAKENAEHGPT